MTTKYNVSDLLAAVEQRHGTQARHAVSALAARIAVDRLLKKNQMAMDECIEKTKALRTRRPDDRSEKALLFQTRMTELFDERKRLVSEYEALP